MIGIAVRVIVAILAANTTKSIVDGARDKVTPKRGSVVYCDLALGAASHSGIYVGNNQIVQLSGNGRVERVTPKKFIQGKTAISIYVSCKNNQSVGSVQVAKRARSLVGSRRGYNPLFDNCHQFSAGCLTGDFESASNVLWYLKSMASDVLGSNTWRHWDIELFD